MDDQRLALAKQMGADEAYNASKEGFADIREDLKARYIDVVVDTSGAQEGLDLAGDLARRGGRINLFGWIKGERAYFNPACGTRGSHNSQFGAGGALARSLSGGHSPNR